MYVPVSRQCEDKEFVSRGTLLPLLLLFLPSFSRTASDFLVSTFGQFGGIVSITQTVYKVFTNQSLLHVFVNI